jgi:hypothetical protein
LEALMFSRTDENDGVYYHPYRSAAYGLVSASNDKNLGTEIDLWATHKYDNGANIGARLGYFTPGKHFTDNNGVSEESSMQFMLSGGFNF